MPDDGNPSQVILEHNIEVVMAICGVGGPPQREPVGIQLSRFLLPSETLIPLIATNLMICDQDQSLRKVAQYTSVTASPYLAFCAVVAANVRYHRSSPLVQANHEDRCGRLHVSLPNIRPAMTDPVERRTEPLLQMEAVQEGQFSQWSSKLGGSVPCR